MFTKHQLLAAIVPISLFLLAASVVAVVLNLRSKPRMDSSEDATEKLRVTSSTWKTVSLECSPKHRGYCLNGGKYVRLTDSLVVACFCKSLYGGKRCGKIFIVPLTDTLFHFIRFYCGSQSFFTVCLSC